MSLITDPIVAREYVGEIAQRLSGNFIGGNWCPLSEESLEIFDPSTGATLGYVSASNGSEVDAAVAAAREALGSWAMTAPAERSRVLLELAQRVEDHANEFAVLEAVDTGKPISAMLEGEVAGIVDSIRYFAGAARALTAPAGGDYVAGFSSTMRREPVGVVAAITPWNYPLLQAVAKVVPALATGNTVVLKPAETTPYATARFVELAGELLPAGVLNLLYGHGSVTGDLLSRHPGVDMVSFTGSIETGMRVGANAANAVTKSIMELGGNSPVIVFADADLESALDDIAWAGLYNGGQECMSASRLIVQDSIFEDFVRGLAARVQRTVIGDALEPRTTLGPMNSSVHRERVNARVARRSASANVVVGGVIPDGPGFFYPPTIIAGAQQDDEVVAEEVFGPVFTVQSFATEAQAIAFANGTRYGLASSVFTKDGPTAARVQNTLNYGTVWVNTHLAFGPDLPVSGFNASGIGTENSVDGIAEFTRLKHVMTKY